MQTITNNDNRNKHKIHSISQRIMTNWLLISPYFKGVMNKLSKFSNNIFVMRAHDIAKYICMTGLFDVDLGEVDCSTNIQHSKYNQW